MKINKLRKETISHGNSSDDDSTCSSQLSSESNDCIEERQTDSLRKYIKLKDICGVEEAPNWQTNVDPTVHDFGKSIYKRLFHIGPISAIFIILTVGMTTTILHASWWPIDTPSGCIDLLMFLTLNYSVLSNFLRAAFVGGGYVPLEWQPSQAQFKTRLQYCVRCNGYKAPRSHHCSKCDRCVMKMDHHCPWINNCVGHRNQTYFIRFLFFSILGCTHATAILGSCLWNIIREIYYYDDSLSLQYLEQEPPFLLTSIYWFFAAIMSLSFSIGVLTALSFLLYVQMKIVLKNTTGIEEYICLKAKYRRNGEEDFVYPYDLGWRRNLTEVWNNGNSVPRGNGIWWPIRKSCTQFTFTEEQLIQKSIKRSRVDKQVATDGDAGCFKRCYRRTLGRLW